MEKTKPKSKKARIENNKVNIFVNVQIFSLICYAVLFLIVSFIALSADLPRKYDGIFSVIMFAICSFITGFYAGIKIRKNGLLVGISYSLPMNIILMLVSLIFADFKADFMLVISLLVLISAAATGGILAVNKRRRR